MICASFSGIEAAILSSNQGFYTALIERELLGGFNLLSRGSSFNYVREKASKHFNFKGKSEEDISKEYKLNKQKFEKILDKMRHFRLKKSESISYKMITESYGIDLYFGQGSFASENTISINNNNITFKNCIISTGSRPIIPKIEGLNTINYYTIDTIMNLNTLPEKIIIIGGSEEACEYAQLFADIGSEVILITYDDSILSQYDDNVIKIVSSLLKSKRVKIYVNTIVIKLSLENIENPDSDIPWIMNISMDQDGNVINMSFNCILIAENTEVKLISLVLKILD